MSSSFSTSSSPSSSSPLSASTTHPSTSTTFSPPVPHTFSPQASLPTGAVPTDNSQQNNNNNSTIATSASLYLYTFLATLVLLLSVSAAIVIRSFVLRRRHRLMVEEAIRNGTWVPPSPPTRPVKVDLSKKPTLWEAYIDGKGDLAGYPTADNSSLRGKKINDVWKAEQTKEWDTIKPIAAAYLAPSASPVTGVVSSGLSTIPSVASLQNRPPGTPELSPPTGPRIETTAGATTLSVPPATPSSAGAPAAAPATSVGERRPRHRAILSRAIQLLNPTPNPTSPLPASLTRSNAGSNANLPGSAENGNSREMTELNGPKVVRIAVLIAMPSPPHSSTLSTSGRSSSSLSSAAGPVAGPSSSSPSSSPPPPPPPSAPPRVGTAVIQQPIPLNDDDEHPLPHLEVGVADVVVVPTDYPVTGDRQHYQKKKAAQRGSLASMATGSEASDL